MKCSEFEKLIAERVGNIFLNEDERRHLDECSNCKEIYASYSALERDLSQVEITPLTSTEFALIQQGLDKRINSFQSRAISFYRLSTRYGAGLIAAAFLFFVSLWSGFEYGVYHSENNAQTGSYYLAGNDTYEDETIDENYVDLLMYDYTMKNGFNSGEILGDLSQDEIEYLEKNLNVGDIL